MNLIISGIAAEDAKTFINLGWGTLPCHSIREGFCSCGRLNCSSPGKHPKTRFGLKDANWDLKDNFDKYFNANLAIVTGNQSGIFVVDLDRNKFNWGGEFPKTFVVQTRRGYHLYYKMIPGLRNQTNVQGMPMDIRAEGGYVMAPGAKHIDGYYTIVVSASIASAPQWLVEIL